MALGASAAAMPWLLLDLASAVGGLADLLACLLAFFQLHLAAATAMRHTTTC